MTADLSARIEARLAEVEAARDAASPSPWRLGGKVPQNVYHANEMPVTQCHAFEDAAVLVLAVNGLRASIAATRDVLAFAAGEIRVIREPLIANEARRWGVT